MLLTETALSRIAEVCHEANRAYCAALGDHSQSSWAEAPEWQKESALLGVRKIADGSTTRPEQSHESWYAQKEADGWVYGDVKDPAAKTHPCMVSFDQLPREQQAKDYVFFAIASTLLSHSTAAGQLRAAQLEGEPIMKFFEFEHLPAHLQYTSAPFGALAQFVRQLPRNAERTVALRKLLEAKDAAVRATIAVS